MVRGPSWAKSGEFPCQFSRHRPSNQGTGPRNFFARNLNHGCEPLIILEPILIGENAHLDNQNPQPFNLIDSNRWTGERFKLPHTVIVRAPGLLPMLYTPGELEQELGVPARAIRDWLDRGLAHQRDERGHIWLDGRQVAAWVKTVTRSKAASRLQADEAYCLRCRQPVKWLNPTRDQRGRQIWWRGVCPQCGSAICRGGQHG